MKTNLTAIFVAAALLVSTGVAAQQSQTSQSTQQQSQGDMAGMNMEEMHHDSTKEPDAARSATDSMSDHMDMNPHMFMTTLRSANPGDQQHAQEIIDIVRESMEKYKDYRVALADGFKIFFPNVPQKQYHFTNYRYAYEAGFAFNPAHPTSLLYKKVNGGYELEGAMFTARKYATEEELNERVPLSVARWHKHVNFCMAPLGARRQDVSMKQFGMGGSIATQDACEQAGGHWIPQVFGWMVHVYPYETDPAKIWAH